MVEFRVGHKYENMKGPYEVISIDGDSMVIRWDSGEECTSTVELQRNIMERMELERREESERRNKAGSKSKKSLSGLGAEFNGLEASDFKNNVAGTSWRSRSSLGGAVTIRLYSDKFNFNSWAVYRMPIIHWVDMKHRQRDDAWLQAKFLAQLNEEHLSYGFYVERSNKPTDPKEDWTGFVSWLKNKNNEDWLNELVSDQSLVIHELGGVFAGMIMGFEGKWELRDEQHGSKHNLDASLVSFLQNLPKERWLDVLITRRVQKEEALERGKKIADDISMLFERLMPLYEASASDAAGL